MMVKIHHGCNLSCKKNIESRNQWDKSWFNMASCEAYICMPHMHTVAQWHINHQGFTVLASASASKIDSKILGIKIGQALSECSFLSIGCFSPPKTRGKEKFSGTHFWSMCMLLVAGDPANDQVSHTPSTSQGPHSKQARWSTNEPWAPSPALFSLVATQCWMRSAHCGKHGRNSAGDTSAWKEFSMPNVSVMKPGCLMLLAQFSAHNQISWCKGKTPCWFTTDILELRNPTNLHGAFIIAPKISS